MLYLVSNTFASHPTSSATLRYYRFLSLSIDQLELDLERHRLEQQAIFTHLMDSGTFRMKIHPTVQEYRRRPSFHPYRRSSIPPTPPSFHNRVNTDTSPTQISTSHHIDINEEVNRLGSMTNIVFEDEEPGQQNGVEVVVLGAQAPGSKSNPIIIRDDKDVCARCNQEGHHQEDCGTPMRTFQHCSICAWTKQKSCTHIDVSPAWLKELKANFEKRNH
jgi:hypothetical protein